MNDKISIIIPMYNSEKTIKNTIESILKESYDNFELIIVDDGSTDSSKTIVESYKDKRIIYKYQDNKGVSSARNTGIECATGKFISFVDADDMIKEEFLKDFISMMEKDEEIDMITCKNYRVKTLNEVTNENSKEDTVIEYSGNTKYKLLYEDYNGYCFNKLYKRSIIMDNNIRFNTNILMGEDTLFNFQYLAKARKIIGINKKNYIYIVNEQSLSKSKSSTRWFTILDSYKAIIDLNLDIEKNVKNKVIYNYYKYVLESKYRIKAIDSKNEEIKNKIKEAEKHIKPYFKNLYWKDKVKLMLFMCSPSLSYRYLQNKKREQLN